MRTPRSAPVLVVSALALVLSLGGVGYAATKIGTNGLKNGAVSTAKLKNRAVTTPKIKNNALTTPKIKNNAVTGGKIKNDTVTGADVAEATLVTPGGTQSFAGIDFKPRNSDLTYGYGTGGSIFRTGGSGFFSVRLDLPQGATISDVTLHLVDNDPVTQVTTYLTRYRPSTGEAIDLAAAFSTNAAGVQHLPLVPDEPVVVDNTTYVYEVLVSPSANSEVNRVVGVQVGYGPSSFGGLVPRRSPRVTGGSASER